MSLKNIKTSTKGFTIVELLIVVVVIAILAAITIVSYNGITSKANDSASKSLLSSVQKKAELFYSEKGGYPNTTSQFQASGTSYDIPAASFKAGAPTATDGTKVVQYAPCGTASGTSPNQVNPGADITYWEYGKSTPGTTTVRIGSC